MMRPGSFVFRDSPCWYGRNYPFRLFAEFLGDLTICYTVDTQLQEENHAFPANRSARAPAGRTDVAWAAHDSPAPHHTQRGRDSQAAPRCRPDSAPRP